MKILHVNSHDLHGARFNGYNMQFVGNDKHIIQMAVWEKSSNNPKVHNLPPSNNRVLKYITTQLITLTAILGFDRLVGFAGVLLPFKSYFRNSDIIHLHLIHNYTNLSILSLPILSHKKPIVWTLHDPWAFTGGCEHSFNCDKWKSGCKGICPYPRATSIFKGYTPFFHWKLKKYLYKKSKITLIVASQWMFDKVKVSPLLKHFPCHLIPFGVDIKLFNKGDKLSAREKLGINASELVIAFRDPGYNVDKFKGMKWMMEALEILTPPKPTTLLIFQDGSAFDKLRSKYKIVKTGWINEEQIALALSASDLFVMPSIQESFGLMAVEAMACELPVIVFDGTALPSIIKSPQGGLVVPSRDSLALSNAIHYLLDNENERKKMGKQARALVEAEYSDEIYVNKHFAIYQEVLNS